MKTAGILLMMIWLGVVACVPADTNLPKEVKDFVRQLKERKELSVSGKQLVVVLNPSACGSCEVEVERLLSEAAGEIPVLLVAPEKTTPPVVVRNKPRLEFRREQLARWGVLNANGSLFVFRDGACVAYFPTDVQHIDDQLAAIKLLSGG